MHFFKINAICLLHLFERNVYKFLNNPSLSVEGSISLDNREIYTFL